jgi:hypothetical protein
VETQQKIYKAMIWDRSPDKPGERVSVLAENLSDAKRQLEEKYGKGNVYDLHNDEDANKAR